MCYLTIKNNEKWESKDLADNIFCFQRCVCMCAHRLTSSKLLAEAKIFHKLKPLPLLKTKYMIKVC